MAQAIVLFSIACLSLPLRVSICQVGHKIGKVKLCQLDQWFPTYWILSPGVMFYVHLVPCDIKTVINIPIWKLFWYQLDPLQVPVTGRVPVVENL